MVVLARGRVVRGPWGWRPLWQRPFSTLKSPKFYLSFTILVSFILVKYPDRIGLVNTVQAGTGRKDEDCVGAACTVVRLRQLVRRLQPFATVATDGLWRQPVG